MDTATANDAPTTPAAKITRLQSYALGDGPSDSRCTVEGTAYARYTSPRNPGPNPDAKHPWERAGLGVAPYKCVGVGTAVYRATPDAPAQPGTSCDYCGQGITNVFSVQGACRSVFKVGCDCVAKCCDKREGVRTQIEAADRKHKNALAKAARERRDAAVQAELAELRAQNEWRLASLPHPKAADMPEGPGREYFAGKTALEWLDYMMRVCGAKGRAALVTCSGLRRSCREVPPCRPQLKRAYYAQCRAPVTISHPRRAGRMLTRLSDLAEIAHALPWTLAHCAHVCARAGLLKRTPGDMNGAQPTKAVSSLTKRPPAKLSACEFTWRVRSTGAATAKQRTGVAPLV